VSAAPDAHPQPGAAGQGADGAGPPPATSRRVAWLDWLLRLLVLPFMLGGLLVGAALWGKCHGVLGSVAVMGGVAGDVAIACADRRFPPRWVPSPRRVAGA
jgi:hypothetical protein